MNNNATTLWWGVGTAAIVVLIVGLLVAVSPAADGNASSLMALFRGSAEEAVEENAAQAQSQTRASTAAAAESFTTRPGTYGEDGAMLVAYTDDGFVPDEVQVRAGTAVRFQNRTEGALRITGTEFDDGQPYPGFDAPTSVPYGGDYIFTFTDEGIWTFDNLNRKTDVGTIVVFAQRPPQE